MSGICAFCERELNSVRPVLPAFVFRWLRGRSGAGHIRSSDNPNLRVQDGFKLTWLCDVCESRFSRFETAFATKIFYPWLGQLSDRLRPSSAEVLRVNILASA